MGTRSLEILVSRQVRSPCGCEWGEGTLAWRPAPQPPPHPRPPPNSFTKHEPQGRKEGREAAGAQDGGRKEGEIGGEPAAWTAAGKPGVAAALTTRSPRIPRAGQEAPENSPVWPAPWMRSPCRRLPALRCSAGPRRLHAPPPAPAAARCLHGAAARSD